MEKKRKKTEKHLQDDGILGYLRFGILPLVVIVLMIVIIRADAVSKKHEAENLSAAMETTEPTWASNREEPAAKPENTTESDDIVTTEPEAESIPEEKLSEEIDISQYTLKQDEVPELLELVQTYCKAKKDCDPEMLAEVFGKVQMTEEELAQEKEKMELVKASIKGYQNISCYSIEGPEEGSYVMFPYFELQYRDIETLVPVLTWAYGKKAETGRYIMTQEVSEEVAAYIRRIGEREDVKALITQVREARQEAVALEEKLQDIYGAAGESQITIG